VEYSGFMLVLGGLLVCLGLGIVGYLFKVCIDWRGKLREEPQYVREINSKLSQKNVETERDLL
jgi:hypothetical protein